MIKKDTLIKAYMDKGFQRRRVGTLSRQTGLSEAKVLLILKLNPRVWHPVKGCKGDMWEMNSNIYTGIMKAKHPERYASDYWWEMFD